MVASQHSVNPDQAFQRRKLYQEGSRSAVSAGEEVVSASEPAEACKQVRELQRMLGVARSNVAAKRTPLADWPRWDSESFTRLHVEQLLYRPGCSSCGRLWDSKR